MKTDVIFKFRIWFVLTMGLIGFFGLNLSGLAKGKIVFTSSRTGNSDIWIMDEDGNNQLQLTTSTEQEYLPTFSWDGTKIAFINGNTKQLVVMNVDGSNQIPIYTTTTHQIAYPAWSPDGRKITFRQGPYNYYDIWVINSDGSNPQNLTKDGHHNGRSSWSPDGSKIVYSRRSIPPFSYSVEVWVMNSDGSNKQPLTSGGSCGYTCENDAPDWSPDGSKIAYDSGAYGHIVGNNMYPHDIYVMNPDGTNKTRITTAYAWDRYPVWSPDGNKIAYSIEPEIYVINADGTGKTRLTFTGNNSLGDWIDVSTVEQVFIDIKPQSCPNPVNIKSKGVLPVAVLGTEDFDVTAIDPASIRLEGIAPIRSSVEDVSTPYVNPQDECDCTIEGEDGFADLTLKFDTQEIVGVIGEVTDGETLVLTLTGELFDGISIEGKDCIIVLSKGNKK